MGAETESYWTKLANDVLEATEQIAIRMEEGINALMSGDAAKSDDQAKEPEQHNDEVLDDEEFDDMDGSPLEGIADSVIGDIMSNQV